jgi:ribonuclease HII
MQDIMDGKNMSPRSKENLINKIKIEHLLWRTDQVFDQRDAENKIVERVDINEDEAELIKKAKKLPPKLRSKTN